MWPRRTWYICFTMPVSVPALICRSWLKRESGSRSSSQDRIQVEPARRLRLRAKPCRTPKASIPRTLLSNGMPLPKQKDCSSADQAGISKLSNILHYHYHQRQILLHRIGTPVAQGSSTSDAQFERLTGLFVVTDLAWLAWAHAEGEEQVDGSRVCLKRGCGCC